jgi:hypothetical protein
VITVKPSLALSQSHAQLYRTLADTGVVGRNGLAAVVGPEGLAGAHVVFEAVPQALDDVALDGGVAQGHAAVGTIAIDGVDSLAEAYQHDGMAQHVSLVWTAICQLFETSYLDPAVADGRG